MSDIEPQPIAVRLEDGEIDEGSEPLVPTSPVIGITVHPIPSPKRGNNSNYDEIAAVLTELGEGNNKKPKPDQADIPTASSQIVYHNDEESHLIDEDEMLYVRGASPPLFVVDCRSLTRKSRPCHSDDFNREVITPQKRRKTFSKRSFKKRSTPLKVFGEKSISSEEDRNDLKSTEGSQSPITPPQQKLDQLCKFYLQDACAKGRSCVYMHSEFPCKFYYTDTRCEDMEKNGQCKLSHNGPLSDNMIATLIRHLCTAPIELLGEKFIDLRAEVTPGDFSSMIHRMHEKLLSQAEESETSTVNSAPNNIAIMREQLPYFLSDEQLDKLIQLRVSKYEDLLSLTLAQLNAIGISASQIEVMQLTLLSSQDVDMRWLFPQCVAQPVELNAVVFPAGDVDLRPSKWEEEDEMPLVIDESYEVQENEIENNEDDIIDVVGDKTPPSVCCGTSEATDNRCSNDKDPLSDIVGQYCSATPEPEPIDVETATLSADNTLKDNPVSIKSDTAQVVHETCFTNDNEMTVQEDEASYTPPPSEQERSYTPPVKVEENSYNPPPKEEESYTPLPEDKRMSPSPLKVVDTLDLANKPKEHVKQLKEHVNKFKENVKEPREQVNEPIVTSIRSTRNKFFIDPANVMDLEPLEYHDERKVASNRRRRHKRSPAVDLDLWKCRNKRKEAPKRNSDDRRENNSSHRNAASSIKNEVPRRQYQKQVDRQMQDNNLSEDWDADEQNETVIVTKLKETAAKEIVCIDSPDNSDDETAAIFANKPCPDFPRRIPNLDNYKPALEIDAHLTYPAMEYKLYETLLPSYKVNKPTLIDKLIKANSSDPRLKKFLEKEKNFGFLPQIDYSFFPPNCNSQCDPRLRLGYANASPEPNYNSSPILYGYLQRSLWYQELKSNLKIQINHSVSDLVRALNAFHKDPTSSKIFDLFQIECAGVLLEVMQNVGIFIDAQGSIIEMSNYQQLCAAPTSQSYTNNNNGAGQPLKPGLLGYAPPGMYPHPPMTPQNNEKSFMQQAFGNSGVQPPKSGFYVRERHFNRNCGGDGNGGGASSNCKQSRSHYRRPH